MAQGSLSQRAQEQPSEDPGASDVGGGRVPELRGLPPPGLEGRGAQFQPWGLGLSPCQPATILRRLLKAASQHELGGG